MRKLLWILLFFSFNCFAVQIEKMPNNNLSKEEVVRFLEWLNSAGNFMHVSKRDIAAHYAHKFKYIINGKVEATDVQGLYQRYLQAKKLYKNAYIHFPIKGIIIDGNQASATYAVTFINKQGRHQEGDNIIKVVFNKQRKVTEFSQTFSFGNPLAKTIQ